MRRSCFAIVLLLLWIPAWGDTYYVDATGGNDRNAGTATNNAWKTISKVNALSFSPGDSILFKRGEMWREQLTVSSSGNSGGPITFGAYGIGEKPIITGSYLLTSWTRIGNTDVYTTSGISRNCFDMYQDHVSLDRASSELCLDGNWFSVKIGTKLWYRPTTGTPKDHTVGRPYRDYGILIEKQHHIIITGLNIQEVRIGIGLNDCNNVIVDSCKIERTWAIGISLDAILDGGRRHDITIQNNVITYNNNGIYLKAYHSKNIEFNGYKNVKILNNTIDHTNWEAHYSKYLGTDGNAIGTQNIHDCIISNNIITYAWEGISNWTSINKTAENNIIMSNYIDHVGRWGIWWGADSSNTLTGNKTIYNVITNCGLNGPGRYPFWGGIRPTGSHSGKNYIYNNTLYANDASIVLYKGDYYEIKNNLSLIPSKYHIYIVDTIMENNAIHYNDYYDNIGVKFYLKNKAYNFTEWVKACNCDAPPYSFSLEPSLSKALPTMPSDFILKSNSPLIDAGANLGLVRDYMGNIVPNGMKPDIGAFEY